jgi:hypothetical protein
MGAKFVIKTITGQVVRMICEGITATMWINRRNISPRSQKVGAGGTARL